MTFKKTLCDLYLAQVARRACSVLRTRYMPSAGTRRRPSRGFQRFLLVTVVVTFGRRVPAMVVRDEHARFDTSHYPAWALAPACPCSVGRYRRVGTLLVRGFYPQLRFQRPRTGSGRADRWSCRGSCDVGIRVRTNRSAGIRYGGPGVPDPRRCALLAEIERLDGRVHFVIPPSLRDDYGRSVGMGGRLLPRLARIGGRRGSAIVPHDADRGARRPLPRREVRSALDTLAYFLLDRVGGGDLVPTTLLLGRLYGRDLAQRHIRAGISLPARFRTDRAPTNQMGTVRVPALVAADNDAWRALRYRVEPSTRQPSSLVDPSPFGWLVAHADHRAALVEHRRPSLPTLRHRRSDKSHPGLRLADGAAGTGVLR